MKQVYEVHYTMEILGWFFPIPFFVWMCIVLKHIRKTTYVDAEQFELVKRLTLGLTCGLQVLFIIGMINRHYGVYSAYHKNDYLIVEGTVENFEGDAAKESFEVSGVKFSYDWRYSGVGYDVLKEEGGVITGNGQKVKIGYVRYQLNNVIVAIWTEE